MFHSGDPIDSTLFTDSKHCSQLSLSQSGGHYEPHPTSGGVCLQIGLSSKRSYWLTLTSVGNFSSRIRWDMPGFPVVTNKKYVRHVSRETLKNATRTSAIYCHVW